MCLCIRWWKKILYYPYMGYNKCSQNDALHCNSDHRCQVKILSSKSRKTILKKRGKKKLLNILHYLIK